MRVLKAAFPPAAVMVTAFALATGAAKADTVQFTVVENVGSGETNTVTFDLPQSPTPSTTTATLFEVTNVHETLVTSSSRGSSAANFTANLFFTDSGGTEAAFDASDSTFAVSVSGLFFNSVTDPTFKVGTYLGSNGDSLTITDISATPLPAALPLFASGIGALGLLGWRKKRRAAA
jgi:hypothetical protein